MADGNGLDIGAGAPREIARVTLILTEAGITFDQATTMDLNVLLHMTETGVSGVKQMLFARYLAQMNAMQGNGIVKASADVLAQIKRQGRGN